MIIYRDGKQYAQCELCPAFVSQQNAEAMNWDWFTGNLHRSYHYCAKHRSSQSRDEMFVRSRQEKTK